MIHSSILGSLHMIVTILQWNTTNINSLWLIAPIWWHRCRSGLAQVMAYHLMAPSQYLYQYLLTMTKIPWHSFHGNVHLNTHDSHSQVEYEINIYLKSQPLLPGDNSLMHNLWDIMHMIIKGTFIGLLIDSTQLISIKGSILWATQTTLSHQTPLKHP